MKRFTDAVENAINHKNWYAALAISLTLPDICGRMERPKEGSEKRYIGWWEKYLLDRYQNQIGAKKEPHVFLSGGDAYALRCAYLHEGGEDITNHRARDALNRFHFITPPAGGGQVHCNWKVDNGKNFLQLQIDVFCKDICEGVENWSRDVHENKEIQERLKGLIVIHDSDQGVHF